MGAPQARLSELAEILTHFGWGVECLTALPNYPTGRVFPGYDPSKTATEIVGCVKVHRVPIRPANQGFVSRLQCYFSFVLSAARFGLRLCSRPDLLFVESPPLFVGLAAQFLARRWRCPYVFNVSDLWPESAAHMGIIRKGLLYRMAEKLELRLYRDAIGVTGQSSEIIESIRRRSPQTRTEIITNGVDPTRFGKSLADRGALHLVGSDAGPIFTYAGLLGIAQGLDQILDLAKSLPRNCPGRFVLVGDGPVREHLQSRIASEGIDGVRFAPAQPRDRIPALLAASDAAIISLGMSIPGAVPSKIYEAMASSLPILLIADGEAARRVNDAECGLAVPPGDPAALKDAFLRLATDHSLRRKMGAAGRHAAETTYNRAAIARKLDSFLRECLPAKPKSLKSVEMEVRP